MKIKVFTKNNNSIIFIAINIMVAFLGFFRSFAFMKFFDLKELGLITLVSTAASLIGFFQIGLINGGYRIISLQEKDTNNKVNNVVFSYFGVLSIVLLGVTLVGITFGIITDLIITFLVISIGVLSLVTNWLTNTLIGAREYNRLNKANILSAIASLVCLVFAYYFGLFGAITSLLIQPLLFVGIVFITDKKEMPNDFDLDFKYIKHILSFGFIPFLSGIFFLIYQQIERWSVIFFLGSEALGKMYLVFLITTLWLLIPTSINNIFFPKSVKYFAEGKLIQLHKAYKQYFLILIIYSLIASILVLFLLPSIVNFVFPKHYLYINFVFIILPGLIIRILCDPISLYMNSIVNLNPIFLSDIISTLSYILMLLLLYFFKIFSIENILICYVFYNIVKFTYLFFNFLVIKKKLNYDILVENNE
jgi:O-antigen/teichoic acid export membrane protein